MKNNLLDGDVTECNYETFGTYSLDFGHAETQYEERKLNLRWNDGGKNVLEHSIQDHLTGHTELRVDSDGGSTIYRCSNSYGDCGGAWYDFALVNDSKCNRTYIGRIMGMFSFATPGFPTPKLTDLDNLPVDTIRERNMTDKTLYIAIRASSKCFTEQALSKRMVTPFQLTDNDAMYILPATAIEMPLFVVRDFRAESRRHYLHCLPRTKWPGLFTLKIKELMSQARRYVRKVVGA